MIAKYLLRLIAINGSIFAMSLAVIFFSATVLMHDRADAYIISTILVAVIIAAFSIAPILRLLLHPPMPRIVPYFNIRLGSNPSDTFNYGFYLAKHCEEVDASATAAGCKPISAYGFEDDLVGEQLIWHDPLDGLNTVKTILENSKHDRALFPEQVILDLDRIANILIAAKSAKAQFCLLVRLGQDSYISLLEMERRKGFFI